jgi:uncharacterized membrane protein YfcA
MTTPTNNMTLQTDSEQSAAAPWAKVKKAFSIAIPVLFLLSLGVLALRFFAPEKAMEFWAEVPSLLGSTTFWSFVLVGFLAQVIDGALGMAYGVSSTSFLLSLGVPPAAASAAVHVAEVFTTGVSGISHWQLGNVNRKLFLSLIIPGVIGAVAGAFILSELVDGDAIKPYIAAYLLLMGIIIIRKALKTVKANNDHGRVEPLALLGGFVDAIGGGGWGPVVNSTLISRGYNVRYSIGSVNTAEFFVALAGAGTFTFFMGLGNLPIIIGLVFGGVFAAPFAALLVKRISPRILMVVVGVLVVALSLRTIVLSVL